MPDEKPKKEYRKTGLHERGFKTDEERVTAMEYTLATKDRELKSKEKELEILRGELRNGRGILTPQKIELLEIRTSELTHACVGLTLALVRLKNEDVIQKELKRIYASTFERKIREEAGEMKVLLRLYLAEIRKQDSWAEKGAKVPLGQKQWSSEELLRAKIRAARVVGEWKRTKKKEFKLRSKPHQYAYLLRQVKPKPPKKPPAHPKHP